MYKSNPYAGTGSLLECLQQTAGHMALWFILRKIRLRDSREYRRFRQTSWNIAVDL